MHPRDFYNTDDYRGDNYWSRHYDNSPTYDNPNHPFNNDQPHYDFPADDDPADCTDHHRHEPGAGDNHNAGAADDKHRTIYCTYCHKYHSVTADETPCSPSAWIDVYE